MPSHPDHFVAELLRWCSACGIQIDERIYVVRGESGHICVVTRDAFIERQTALVIIPKSAILSIRNCLLAEHIPQVTYGTEAQLGLALGLFGEILRGSSSPWAGYLQSLPKRVNIALFWNDNNEDEKLALKWAEGTMVDVERFTRWRSTTLGLLNDSEHTQTLSQNLLRYYEFAALPALAKVKLDGNATPESFRHAFALVSSRSFIVDAYHGLAMVPIADAFNHSLENHVHLESDHEVCRICGSLKECSHDNEGEGDDECVTAREEQASSDLNSLENTCEMVTNAFVPPFTEVFNTYGEHLTNAQLLVRYGFLLDINENDVIAWDARQLCSLVASFGARSSRGVEICVDEEPMSKDHDQSFGARVEQIPESAGRADAHEHQNTSHPRVSFGKTVLRTGTSNMGDEDRIPKIYSGQVLLERLQEVIELWTCSDTVWADSSLVYFHHGPCGEDAALTWQCHSAFEAAPSVDDYSLEACDEDTNFHEERSRRQRRYRQLSFTMDSEAKISHHLWIFCVLLVLHEEWLRSVSTDVDMEYRACPPRRDEIEEGSTSGGTYLAHPWQVEGQGPRHVGKIRAESIAKPTGLVTTAGEDLTLLQRVAFVQDALEHSDSGSDMNSIRDSEKEGFRSRASSESFAMKTNQTPQIKAGPVGKGASSSSGTSAARRYEQHLNGLRKRVRSETSSLSSIQSDDSLARIRLRRAERVGVSNSTETREAVGHTHEAARNVSCEQDLAPLANRQDQGRDGGLLSVLLRDYGIDSDSDNTVEPDPAYGTQSPSALSTSRKVQNQDENCLADVDPGRKPERLANFPEKEDRFSDQRDTEDVDSADAAVSQFPLDFATARAPKMVNSRKGCDFRDESLVRLVASIARDVSALCETRSRGMAHPNLSAAELGEVVDAISPEMTQACMAAQLALSERARLEACAAAWKELALAASHIELSGIVAQQEEKNDAS